jgi:hypothetical protein
MSYNAGGLNIFGWQSEGRVRILSNKTLGDVCYNPVLLKSSDNVNVLKSFMDYVDKQEAQGELSKYKIG